MNQSTPAAPGGGGRATELADVIVDPGVVAAIEERGYAIFPALDEPAVAELRRRHAELHPDGGFGFEVELSSVCPRHRRGVHDVLQPVWQAWLAPRLRDPRIFMTSFATKWPGASSALPVHQDWSCVDERRHRSLVAWLALEDTSPERRNGPLAVIPGSHRFMAPPRGANSIPWYSQFTNYLRSNLVELSVRSGEVVLFDGRLLHGSSANMSNEARVSAVTRIAPRLAPLVYVNETEESQWEFFSVDEDFFIERGPLDLRARPPIDRPVLERRSAVLPDVTVEQVAELCGSDAAPEFVERFVNRGEFLGSPSAAPHSGHEDSKMFVGEPGPRRTARMTEQRIAPGAARCELEAMLALVGSLPRSSGPPLAASDDAGVELVDLDDHDNAPRQLLRAVMGDRSSLPSRIRLLRLGPGARLGPVWWPVAARATVVVLDAARPTGSAVLRCSREHVALAAGTVVSISGPTEVEMWNLSARAVTAVVAADGRCPLLV